MKRDLFEKLLTWKNSPTRKPLILMGARQVGKTTLLKTFGEQAYQTTVYLNFELEPNLCKLFESSLKPIDIIRALEIEKSIKIDPLTTLIIFDEIQECPSALNSLKYFCELAREYTLCAAGSLLGVKLINTKGFPVGKVDFLHLYPLNFLEFLDALNEKELKNYVNDLNEIQPLFPNLHEKLIQYLKLYLFVGGMPEAVVNYLHSQDVNRVREIQQAILNAYSLDFAKHAPSESIMKINLIWNSIPTQLSKKNKKFIYSILRKGARAKEFENALQWLFEAGLIYKITNISTPKLPLDSYSNFDFFKIYMLDVGLLAAMSRVSPKAIIHGDELFQEFRGSLIENFVNQELIQTYKTYYWTSEGTAEVDFIVQDEETIFPIEVKSGSSNKKKSLLSYANKYHSSLIIRTSPMNLKKEDQLLNIPLYLMGNLKKILRSLNKKTS